MNIPGLVLLTMFCFGNNLISKQNGGYEVIPDHNNTDFPVEIESSNIQSTYVKQFRRRGNYLTFRRRRGIVTIFCFVSLVVTSCIFVITKRNDPKRSWDVTTTATNANSNGVNSRHRETLPTFLSLMQRNAETNDNNNVDYVYALDNPYYDLVTHQAHYFTRAATTPEQSCDDNKSDDTATQRAQQKTPQIRIHWSIDHYEKMDTRISSSLSDIHSSTRDRYSMSIQWQTSFGSFNDSDNGHDFGSHDDTHDLFILQCTTHDDNTNILEVATLAQVRATHQEAEQRRRHPPPPKTSTLSRLDHPTTTTEKNDNGNIEFWYIPNVPSTLFRQSECQWVYYYYSGNFNSTDNNRMENDFTKLYVQQYIPIGASNRYQMSTLRNALQPTNIHIALTSRPDQMIIQFTTGGSIVTDHMASMIGTPIVEYSDVKHQHWSAHQEDNDTAQEQASRSSTSSTTRVSGMTDTYTSSEMCQEPANVTGPGKFVAPGNLHTVVLSNLQPNTMYTYRVGMETGQGVIWNSHTGTFQTTVPPGTNDTIPVTFLVYGDQGCPATGWDDGQLWIEGMVQREVFLPSSSPSLIAPSPVRMIHHVGDLSYAQGAAHIWDAWLDMIQPISMYVPIMVAVGNHEYDHMSGGGSGKDPSKYVATDSGFMPVWGNFANDSGGECGVPTSKRFTMPSGSINNNNKPELQNNGVFWYWYDYGLLRTIVVSSEHDLSEGSIQHTWLEYVLFNTDRTLTPWVIVELHRPLYEMEEALFPNPQNIGIAMRYEFEDLLHDYKVDIVFAGHFHTYHRTCDGLYRSRCQNGGPMHITIGTAGAHLNEVMSLDRKPSWTDQIIFKTFGYGRVTVANSTVIHFEFIKAGNEQFDLTAGTVLDEVYITRYENR